MNLDTYRKLTPEQKEQVVQHISKHSVNSYAAVRSVADKIDKFDVGALSPNNMLSFTLLLDDVPDEIINQSPALKAEQRICYFGTRGKPGHFPFPIVGKFTRKELDNIEKIDQPVYHEAMKADGFIYGTLDNFMYYAIPHSMDDRRPGCISAIFVEFASSSKDIREAIMSDPEFRLRFSKRYPKEDEI